MTSRTFSGTRLAYSFSYVVYRRGTSRGQEDGVIRPHAADTRTAAALGVVNRDAGEAFLGHGGDLILV